MFRRFLVVTQFSLSVFLIIATLVIFKQLNYIRSIDMGYDREHIIHMSLVGDSNEKYEILKQELGKGPNVVSVSASFALPTKNFNSPGSPDWEGRPEDKEIYMNVDFVDFDYFETLGMEIIQGRSFSEDLATDEENYILSETAARMTGLDSPVGKLFSVWENEGSIIGIVRDFHSQSLHTEIGPVVFTLSQRHGSHRYVFVKVRGDSIPKTLDFLREKVGEFAPNSLFEYQFLDDVFDGQYRSDRRRGAITSAFTVLAVFISCLGLFGMASFTAEQRTKEIGIRKVLGASVSRIFALISRDFLILLAVSNLIAWPAAYLLMDRLLSNYAYRTGIALWVFAAAGIATVVIALLTVCLKIARAARADPVESLRYE